MLQYTLDLMSRRKPKSVIVPMSLALHTKFKWRASQDGQSMSEIIRSLVSIYVGGDPRPRDVVRDNGEEDESYDFFDYLHDLVVEAVGE